MGDGRSEEEVGGVGGARRRRFGGVDMIRVELALTGRISLGQKGMTRRGLEDCGILAILSNDTFK